MSSTYSTNLAIELIGAGDQAGNWGSTTNTNLGTLIEQAISGYVTQAVSTGTDTTMTIPSGASTATLNARNMFIELTGTGGANTNLVVPANKKLYFVYNNTSSGQVTVKVSGQTGISVVNATKVVLVSNGTDIVNATSYGVIQSVNGVVFSSGSTLTAATGAQMVAAIGSTAVTNATNATAITNTGGWSVTPTGSKLFFNYNGTNVASLDSSGNLITLGAVSAGGTP